MTQTSVCTCAPTGAAPGCSTEPCVSSQTSWDQIPALPLCVALHSSFSGSGPQLSQLYSGGEGWSTSRGCHED